jgi:hypothetical protein
MLIVCAFAQTFLGLLERLFCVSSFHHILAHHALGPSYETFYGCN